MLSSTLLIFAAVNIRELSFLVNYPFQIIDQIWTISAHRERYLSCILTAGHLFFYIWLKSTLSVKRVEHGTLAFKYFLVSIMDGVLFLKL